jgi:hypothetical protein
MTSRLGLRLLSNSLGDKARCQKWMEMSLALCTHAVNGDSTKAEVSTTSNEICIHLLMVFLVQLYRCYERLLLRLS